MIKFLIPLVAVVLPLCAQTTQIALTQIGMKVAPSCTATQPCLMLASGGAMYFAALPAGVSIVVAGNTATLTLTAPAAAAEIVNELPAASPTVGTYTLAKTPDARGAIVYRNGMREAPCPVNATAAVVCDYTLTGATVVFVPLADVQPSDVILVDYWPAG